MPQKNTTASTALGVAIAWAGLILVCTSIYMAGWPNNFIVRNIPEWMTVSHPALNLIWGAVGIFFMIVGGLVLHDSQPIPDEYVEPPTAPNVRTREAWRAVSGFRYLENLKEQCRALEKDLQDAYRKAQEAHRHLSNPEGYFDYSNSREKVQEYAKELPDAEHEILRLKGRIAKVFAGDVRSDVQELETEIEKLQLKKQHKQRDYQDLDLPQEDRSAWSEIHKHQHKKSIRSIEVELVEKLSLLKELKHFDFSRLYEELGVSAEAMRAEAMELNEIATKTRIVTAIRPTKVGKQRSEDEVKMDAAAQRIRHDINFDVEQRLARKLTTLEAIQNFQKTRSEQIKNDNSLSYDEKTERLDQLRKDCEEYKQSLRSEVNIYEDD